LREITGEEVTAKDFRTWAATNLAALALQRLEVFDSHAKAKKNVLQAVEAVAKMLGNTPAICRKCYIHPAIFNGYLDGTLLQLSNSAPTRSFPILAMVCARKKPR
jgi:DNA topoisomerase I